MYAACLDSVDREWHKLEVRTEVLPFLLPTRIKAAEEALLAQCFMHWRIPFPFASFPRCGLLPCYPLPDDTNSTASLFLSTSWGPKYNPVTKLSALQFWENQAIQTPQVDINLSHTVPPR